MKTSNPRPQAVVASVASVLAVVGAFLGIMAYFTATFVLKAELEKEHDLRIQQEKYMSAQLVSLVENMLISHNLSAQEIRDARGYSIIVLRDIMKSRTDLTASELSELSVLEAKISELNLR